MTTATKTTVLPAAPARGVNKKTAPMTTHHPRDKKAKRKAAPKAKRTGKAKPAAAPAKATKGNTFTTVDVAVEHGINAKTLRARIRRNLADWEPLFKDGTKHVFPDNKTTRSKITALLS